ncbi:MAG: ferric iron uptake transcriptional regulator [Ectothiorhodospiraceae bacterium]|nr:ferric iron uptake transcriptional regulator [Ectothiorhodospiraceae bacterium]MCH8506091.1 ferric iron uptake transcriptional regulator [Ectothiorhodospiraceae bacterium]
MQTKDLRKAGLKVTLPRMKILEMLESSNNRHLSAEDVYKGLMESGEDIGLATVYRVLTQFESAGLVQRHHFEGGQSVFELDEGEHHDHMVCLRCGAIEEFFDEVIESRQEKAAKEHGFRVTDHSLILYGQCKECQKEEN